MPPRKKCEIEKNAQTPNSENRRTRKPSSSCELEKEQITQDASVKSPAQISVAQTKVPSFSASSVRSPVPDLLVASPLSVKSQTRGNLPSPVSLSYEEVSRPTSGKRGRPRKMTQREILVSPSNPIQKTPSEEEDDKHFAAAEEVEKQLEEEQLLAAAEEVEEQQLKEEEEAKRKREEACLVFDDDQIKMNVSQNVEEKEEEVKEVAVTAKKEVTEEEEQIEIIDFADLVITQKKDPSAAILQVEKEMARMNIEAQNDKDRNQRAEVKMMKDIQPTAKENEATIERQEQKLGEQQETAEASETRELLMQESRMQQEVIANQPKEQEREDVLKEEAKEQQERRNYERQQEERSNRDKQETKSTSEKEEQRDEEGGEQQEGQRVALPGVKTEAIDQRRQEDEKKGAGQQEAEVRGIEEEGKEEEESKKQEEQLDKRAQARKAREAKRAEKEKRKLEKFDKTTEKGIDTKARRKWEVEQKQDEHQTSEDRAQARMRRAEKREKEQAAKEAKERAERGELPTEETEDNSSHKAERKQSRRRTALELLNAVEKEKTKKKSRTNTGGKNAEVDQDCSEANATDGPQLSSVSVSSSTQTVFEDGSFKSEQKGITITKKKRNKKPDSESDVAIEESLLGPCISALLTNHCGQPGCLYNHSIETLSAVNPLLVARYRIAFNLRKKVALESGKMPLAARREHKKYLRGAAYMCLEPGVCDNDDCNPCSKIRQRRESDVRNS